MGPRLRECCRHATTKTKFTKPGDWGQWLQMESSKTVSEIDLVVKLESDKLPAFPWQARSFAVSVSVCQSSLSLPCTSFPLLTCHKYLKVPSYFLCTLYLPLSVYHFLSVLSYNQRRLLRLGSLGKSSNAYYMLQRQLHLVLRACIMCPSHVFLEGIPYFE